MMSLRSLVMALSIAVLPCAAIAQDPPTGGQDPPQGGGRGGRAQEPEIKPYERVITKDARSDDGIFTVHRIKDRVYYEIPKDRLGREFLWVSQIARTTLGAGYGGQAVGNRVVRWDRRGDRVLLRAVSYDVVADTAAPIARAVEAANYNPIVMAFNIEALGKDDAPVIEVTRLFTTDVPEFSGRTRVNARSFDVSRSFVERVLSFPENINVEATHTYNNPPQEPGGGRGGPAPPAGRGATPLRPGSHSVLMTTAWSCCPRNRCSRDCSTNGSATSRCVRWTTAGTSTAHRSVASSRAGGSKRKTRRRSCQSPSSRSCIGLIQRPPRSGCRT